MIRCCLFVGIGKARTDIVERLFLHKRQNVKDPASRLELTDASIWVANEHVPPATGRKVAVQRLVIHKPQAQLFKIVLALTSSSSFSRRLYGGQEECHENANNCDHHQQLH